MDNRVGGGRQAYVRYYVITLSALGRSAPGRPPREEGERLEGAPWFPRAIAARTEHPQIGTKVKTAGSRSTARAMRSQVH